MIKGTVNGITEIKDRPGKSTPKGQRLDTHKAGRTKIHVCTGEFSLKTQKTADNNGHAIPCSVVVKNRWQQSGKIETSGERERERERGGGVLRKVGAVGGGRGWRGQEGWRERKRGEGGTEKDRGGVVVVGDEGREREREGERHKATQKTLHRTQPLAGYNIKNSNNNSTLKEL